LEGLNRLEVIGVNLNLGDYDNRTPAHLAASAGHIDIIKYLVKKNVNLNVEDRWGAHPLDDAKTDEIAEFLITNGAVKGKKPTY